MAIIKRPKTTMTKPSSSRSRSSGSRSSNRPVMWLFVCFLSSVLAFYGGLILGWHTAPNDNNCGGTGGGGGLRTVASPQETTLIASLQKRQRELEAQLQMANATTTAAKSSSSSSSSSLVSPHFSDAFETSHTGGFASGMEFVDRDDFASVFDVGVPLDASSKGNDRVLLVYSDPKAFPNTKTQTTAKTTTTTTALSALDATANCHNLHLVYTQKRDRQCLAIMGQYESFHVHKYMRIDQKTKKMDAKHPLVYVDRGRQQNGRISAKVPTIEATKEHWTGLTAYLQSLETALEQIKPTLEAVASHNSNNAIIVLVSNFGHSELLANFVCNARAKGLDRVLSSILLFATDESTHKLAKSLGITSVYIDSVFGNMPEQAAGRYADKTFRAMMIAKVYCIHMVSMLGYDILFQDVDVVWYRDPLEYFADESSPHHGFDVYFQDDGNHALFYAPYSANTGFYYVRNNDKTKYFFNSFLMQGDRIFGSGSHQIPLIAHLSEQASLHGLRVKILDRIGFPGGKTYHSRGEKPFLKDLMSGAPSEKKTTRDTQIFHMSWTNNKVNKIKFYQQMGEWYLKETCSARHASSELKGDDTRDCCVAEPIVSCYYRDKPSKVPCKDSPPIDKGGSSWW